MKGEGKSFFLPIGITSITVVCDRGYFVFLVCVREKDLSGCTFFIIFALVL